MLLVWPKQKGGVCCTFLTAKIAESDIETMTVVQKQQKGPYIKFPKQALGMFRSRIRRVWGHAAIFAWS